MHIFDLKADEFINSIKLSMFKRPPLSDENSDLVLCTIFYSPFDFTSSYRGYPLTTLLNESVIYCNSYGTIYDTDSRRQIKQHYTYLKLSLNNLSMLL